jgi:hypothetical protein
MQFRVVQKALLVRLKEDKPTPTGSLAVLLEATYQEVSEISDKATDVDKELQSAWNMLACGTRLLLCGLRCGQESCRADTALPGSAGRTPLPFLVYASTPWDVTHALGTLVNKTHAYPCTHELWRKQAAVPLS